MDQPVGNEDAWVLSRITALERGNRRLWITIAALAMMLVSVCLAIVLFAASVELPDGTKVAGVGTSRGDLDTDDLTVHGALRVVDAQDRNLVWIGAEPVVAGAGATAGQTVIGLFAGGTADSPQQTVRLATSARGSALALSTPDGTRSASIFAGENGGSLELRRGETTRLISERPDSEPATRAPAPAEAAPTGTTTRAETPTVSASASADGARGSVVDLSDPAMHPIGNGFYVGRLSLSDERGGLRVSGRLVNAESVDQLRAEFRLTVAGREVPFSVARIAAGAGTDFAVEIPDADAAALRTARMRWVRSTVSYISD